MPAFTCPWEVERIGVMADGGKVIAIQGFILMLCTDAMLSFIWCYSMSVVSQESSKLAKTSVSFTLSASSEKAASKRRSWKQRNAKYSCMISRWTR